MKVAYISPTYFSDVDFSFIKEMKNKVDLYYFINLSPTSLKKAAINIEKQYPKSGIFKAVDIYPAFSKFSTFIDLDKSYVINRMSTRSMNLTNILINIKLLFFLLKLKVDIIHITDFYKIGDFILYLLKSKTVLTVHDPFLHSSCKSKIVELYRKIAFFILDNFIILNESQKEKFITYYQLGKKNVFVSRLSIYDYLNIYANSKCFVNKRRYILFFGLISSYKGLDYLFPAMKRLHNVYQDIDLIVAGKGDYYFDLTEYQKLDYFDIQNRFIPDDELAILIKNSLFVVCPYIDATQSGVVMSAFAFNKSVLATNTGGLPEMVEHLKSGYIVPVKNEIALYDAMKYLLSNEEVLKKQSNYIEKQYRIGEKSWAKITENMFTGIYEKIKDKR